METGAVQHAPWGAVPREILRFIGRHARLLPILVALPFALVVVHEGSHAAAAMLQGGSVTRWDLGPWSSAGRDWGAVWLRPQPRGWACDPCISLAPYVLWALLSALTAAAILSKPARDRERSLLFVAGYAVMPLDLLQHVGPWIAGSRRNDLANALGPVSWAPVIIIAGYGAVVAAAGYFVQRREYGRHALSPRAYCVLALLTAVAAPMASALLKHAAGRAAQG